MTKVIGRPSKLVLIISALLVALAISACGGSSGWTSSEKAKARSALNNEFSSLISGVKLTKSSKAAWEKFENCALNTIETHFSPNDKATGTKVNKVLDGACGSESKAFQKAILAQEKSSS